MERPLNTADRSSRDWELPLSNAFPMWVVASVAGWVVIAGLLMIGTDLGENAGVASNSVRELVDFSTAAGTPAPGQ